MSAENLKTSVGLCVKNMPRTLPFTLQSLLNQTIASDSELIFVTPDIEDPSLSIFKSFLDKLTDK
ncbi:MAG: glycosyltransferase [Thermoproteota archaeon]